MAHVNTMDATKIMEDVDTTSTNPGISVKEDAAHRTTGIGAEAVVVKPKVISQINVAHTEYMPIQAKTLGPQKTDTKRTRCGVTRCW